MCANVNQCNEPRKSVKNVAKTASEQRVCRRQRLIERFKSLRIQAIDKFRQIKDEKFTSDILHEIRKEILSTLHEEVVEEEELNHFLQDIRNDFQTVLLQQQEETEEKEIESITNNLMNKCDICEDLTVESTICDLCFSSQVQ